MSDTPPSVPMVITPPPPMPLILIQPRKHCSEQSRVASSRDTNLVLTEPNVASKNQEVRLLRKTSSMVGSEYSEIQYQPMSTMNSLDVNSDTENCFISSAKNQQIQKNSTEINTQAKKMHKNPMIKMVLIISLKGAEMELRITQKQTLKSYCILQSG